jgi:ATP-binding cassette subfamily B protein
MKSDADTTEAPARWADIWRHVRGYRAPLVQGAVLLLLTNLLDKSIPWVLKGAVDGLRAADVDLVRRHAFVVAGLAAVVAVTRTHSRMRVFNVGRDIEFDLRNEILRKLQALGPAFFQRMTTGETMSRSINDLAQVRALVGFGSLNLVNSFLAYAFALAFMLSMSVELTLWALLPYPLLIVISRAMGKSLYNRSRASQEALGALATQVQETLSGIRIVRAFAIELDQEARFERANQSALQTNMALAILRGLFWPLLLGVGTLGTLLIVWRGTDMARAGELSYGEVFAFLAYGESLRWPTMGLGYIMAVLQRGRASYARIREILEAEPDVRERPDAREPEGPGAVEVRDLSYAYGDEKVLDRVSFRVPAGGSLALVGRTGSGKSTLAALLPRLLPTPAGAVFLDGQDVTELKLRPLRRAVGYAQQDPFLFSASVARNVGYRFDDPYAPVAMARVREAAREAAILDEVESLGDGFDTIVGERGVQLSGGQKQRVALARALLNEPKVLVMDDPLSAVDARTEAAILDALDRAGRGRTMILITNRVAAAARCRDIVVLDAGRVVEHGDHPTLLQAGGLYAQLAARQRTEAELAAI